MPDQIFIGNFPKGLTLNVLPFFIDNNSFPLMYNFYSWRGRVKKKRGTILLGILQRQLQLESSPNSWQFLQITLSGGAANLLSNYSLGSSSSIVPGSLSLTGSSDGTTYTDPSMDGTLFATGGTGTGGTINYATGAITITSGASESLTGTFNYYPGLPVMGLEDLMIDETSPYPLTLDFDTKYAYQFNQSTSSFYSVSYYKATNNPVVWTGQDYQQFWSTNYQGAFWASNNQSISSPPSMQFVNGTYSSGTTTTSITFNFKSATINFTSLVVGDVLWFNEWSGGTGLNGITGVVSDISGASSGNYVVTFTVAQTVSGTGMAQLLTNSVSDSQNGIRWYDGDPTGGTGLPITTDTGWVNFAPPLTATNVSINDLPSDLYYLVGAKMIVAFKDRLLFFGVWVQTSDVSSVPIYLQDTVIWSWNGTPYYAPLVPSGQTFDPTAYYVDETGKGGYLSAGLSQPITTLGANEDVLLVGFTGRQTRFVFTGNDFNPFLFFNINSELGSSATFSGVTLDRGVLAVGSYGITMTTQQSTQRIDLEIPDSVFEVSSSNNGALRVNSARDFYKEWIYFSYPTSSSQWKFPTRSFMYNYRDNTWAVFYENFTAHGSFRRVTGLTWAQLPYSSWTEWTDPWDSGVLAAQFPNIIAGNPQGYVVIKGQSTGESVSGTISAISSVSNSTETQITSVNHCVSVGDYLYIQNAIGTTWINNQIGRVTSIVDSNIFTIDITFEAGTYLGLGQFTRLIQPIVQTKQFNDYWPLGKKIRAGVQKYLLDRTANSQITLNMYLSQDPDNVWNSLNEQPDLINSSLVSSQILYTCPENEAIGLTPSNYNLQMSTANTQRQIWHRMNTSFIGDTIQFGLTLSDAQMRNIDHAFAEITLHSAVITVYPSGVLS